MSYNPIWRKSIVVRAKAHERAKAKRERQRRKRALWALQGDWYWVNRPWGVFKG